MATEGELWAQTELHRLRAARFTVPALGRFLLASRRRAAHNRARRPAAARRAAAWMGVGAVAWTLRPVRRAARAGLAWWAVCALMLDWHLGMLETPDGEPVALGAPDACTLMRAWLVPVVARDPASLPVLLGGLSDLADGALARRTRATRLGRDLEGVVDACFVVAALSATVRTGRLSRLPAALELGRIAAGTAYALAVYFGSGHAPDRTVSAAGRRAAPIRAAGLAAAASGHRRLADGLLTLGTGVAVTDLVSRAPGAGARS